MDVDYNVYPIVNISRKENRLINIEIDSKVEEKLASNEV